MSLAKLQDLTGRVALVTGGSRGLGLQMAEVLGELGAKVAITARKHDELEAAAAHLKSLGIEALPVVCDMGDLATIPPMIEQVIASLGPVDILVNNAGTSWGAPTIEHSLDGWNKVITLNVTAIFVGSQEVGRRCMLPRRRGNIERRPTSCDTMKIAVTFKLITLFQPSSLCPIVGAPKTSPHC